MEGIAISEFKAKCLAILERVRRTKKPIRITRFGKPVAEVVAPSPVEGPRDWFGSMADTMEIVGDVVSPVIEESDQWAAYAPAEAAPWLQSLPEGPSRDEAIGGYAITIASTYPEMAVQWAETIDNPQLRSSRLESLARTWLRTDANAARSWIAQSSLPEQKKRQLLGLAPPPGR